MERTMLRIVTAFCAAAVLSAGVAQAGAAAGEKITLIANGASDYVIVVPGTPDPHNRVGQAANLLQATLLEAAGVKLPIVKEPNAPQDKPRIYLGRTEAALAAGLPLDSLTGWSFIKRVAGKDLFLAGIDTKEAPESESLAILGTVKAVGSFLEDEAGVRFLLPGPYGTHVPKLAALSVDANLNVRFTPPVDYVTGRWMGQPFMAVNNLFPPGIFKSYGGHSYYTAVPKEKYARDHPEYFALLNGQRSPSLNHLCVSNPDVQRLMLNEIEKEYALGYDWVELSQTDGYMGCQCDACKAISTDDGERLWIVHRKLAQIMKERHPDRPEKKVVIISYGPTGEPPKSFDKFPDNVVIEMCGYSTERFEKWSKFGAPFTVYMYNWGLYQSVGFAPKRTPKYIGDEMKRFAKYNVRGIYSDGYRELNGLEGPTYYVFEKMLQNLQADPYVLADDYYAAAFGKAVVPMKAFYEALHNRLELYSITGFAAPDPTYAARAGHREWLMPPTPEDTITYFYPPRLMLFMEEQLKRAMSLDDDVKVKARLRLVQREFEYLKNLSSVFYYYEAYRLHPDWNTFDLLASEIEKRNALLDSWYVKGADGKEHFRVEDGWASSINGVSKSTLKENGFMLATLSAPFNWDTKLLREKKVLPGASKKSLQIARLTAPITLDGSPDKPAWANIQAEELGEIGMGALKEGTTFKTAYDDKALYFAFRCQLSTAATTKLVPLGKRDGKCWTEECLEILVDPYGTREKAYHLIFNPVPDSRYDERIGFITDPTHPLFGDWDPAWDGDWEYVAKMDVEKKQWTVEVRLPFATLGVPPPQRGAVWAMNIGRENYPNGYGGEGMEYSLWSPNLEARGIRDLTKFGNLIFE